VCQLKDNSSPDATKDYCGGHGTPITHALGSWCGSNYDALGNPRFSGASAPSGIAFFGYSMTADQLMNQATYTEDLGFGLMNFDHIGIGFMTIFQIVTLEGWTGIMYQTVDAVGWVMPSLFYTLLVFFGSFFVLNLVLAVLENQITGAKEEADKKKKEEQEAKAKARNALSAFGGGGLMMQALKAAKTAEPKKVATKHTGLLAPFKHCADFVGNMFNDYVAWLAKPPKAKLRYAVRILISDQPWFEYTTLFLIFINTIVLACDRRIQSDDELLALEIINFILTIYFALEMGIKIFGGGT
jgi:hypothetical protein